MKMLFKSPVGLWIALVLICTARPACGQQPTAQPTADPESQLQKLKDELELEKVRTALAEQKKKTLAAILPTDSNDAANKTLKGDITITDKTNPLEIESVALSYEAVSIMAGQISGKLRTDAQPFNQIIIYSDADFPTLIQYRFFKSQAEPALSAYKTLLTRDPAARGPSNENPVRGLGPEMLQAPTIGSAIVKSGIDLISLFRTDTAITNRNVKIEETALGALVANETRSVRPGLKIYFPKAYIPEHNWNPEDERSVLTQLTALYAYRAVTKTILAEYEKTAPAEREKHVYHGLIPALTALNEQVGRFLANYENKEGETANNRLRDLLRAEQLNQMLESDPNTAILQLKVLDAGGSERITRNLIFGSKVRHSGSAIVEYMLFDKTGALRSSQLFYYHTGFRKMDKPRYRDR
jgi:hypothetical protein